MERTEGLKLHVGCGKRHFNGYINIDINNFPAVDLQADASDLSKHYSNNSIDEISAYHVLEHMERPVAVKCIKHWYNLLKKEGKIIIEVPDFEKVIDGLVNNTEPRAMEMIFGMQRFPGDAHHWGYTRKTLRKLLEKVGFKVIHVGEGTDYHQASGEPCIRVEGIK